MRGTDHAGCLLLKKKQTKKNQTLKANYCPVLCKAGQVGNICATGIHLGKKKRNEASGIENTHKTDFKKSSFMLHLQKHKAVTHLAPVFIISMKVRMGMGLYFC